MGERYTKLERYWLRNFVEDNPHVGTTELAQMAADYGILFGRGKGALITQISNMRKEPLKDSANATLKKENEELKRQNAELQQNLDTLKESIIGHLHLRDDEYGNRNKYVALSYNSVKMAANIIWHAEYNAKISELYEEEGINAHQEQLLQPEGESELLERIPV